MKILILDSSEYASRIYQKHLNYHDHNMEVISTSSYQDCLRLVEGHLDADGIIVGDISRTGIEILEIRLTIEAIREKFKKKVIVFTSGTPLNGSSVVKHLWKKFPSERANTFCANARLTAATELFDLLNTNV